MKAWIAFNGEKREMFSCKNVYFSLAIFASAALTGLLAISADASAQGRRDTCESYADDAVRQHEVNERRNCGYEGPRWSDNRTAHFGWCMIVPRQAQKEAEARKDQLDACRDNRRGNRRDARRGEREGRRANCDTYAKIAVVQADANKKYDCGYRGGEWEDEARPHFRWCMRTRRSHLSDELRFRTAELQKCFNKLGDDDEDSDDRGHKRRKF
jgi:hypothetical protein